ncbi:MAG: hypothetical protein O3C43_16800 [Verrucomicrobia bacterium]|nr:hypothetical protein [Verrucomicrobiota bacterium]MDA1068148.1 hypothetical protein [Verrucomicrobiota bacterium]
MNNTSDAQFEASIEKYYRETYNFRYQLDNRTEEELVRDDYVLDQHTRGKRMKVVLRKASKKLKLPELAPDSPQYPNWARYYEDLLAIIMNDMKIEAYQKNKLNIEETKKAIAEKEENLRALKHVGAEPEGDQD